MKKKRKNSNYLLPPAGASRFFSPAADKDFENEHPVGYKLLLALGITALLTPMIIYGVYTKVVYNDNSWRLLGMFGAFLIGIGLFNFVAIIIRQYLGHLVSIVSFILGGACMWISLIKLAAL